MSTVVFCVVIGIHAADSAPLSDSRTQQSVCLCDDRPDIFFRLTAPLKNRGHERQRGSDIQQIQMVDLLLLEMLVRFPIPPPELFTDRLRRKVGLDDPCDQASLFRCITHISLPPNANIW